jgi:hypothetical protein
MVALLRSILRTFWLALGGEKSTGVRYGRMVVGLAQGGSAALVQMKIAQ